MHDWRAPLYCLVIAITATPTVAAESFRQSLAGYHSFSLGDNASWSRLDVDDRLWQKIRVPGSWQAQGFPTDALFGWYRIWIRIPSHAQGQPLGVSLGVIGSADETFFNGVKIGGKGRIGTDFVESAWQERLYRIPDELVQWDARNLIAIRAMHFYEGGILAGPIEIGNYLEMSVELAQRQRYFAATSAVFATFYVLSILFCVCLYLCRVNEPEYKWLGLMMLTYGLFMLCESPWFEELGWKTPLVERALVIGAVFILPPIVLRFARIINQQIQMTWAERMIQAWCGTLILASVSVPSPVHLYRLIIYAGLPMFVISACWALWCFGISAWHNRQQSRILLAGVSLGIATHMVTLFGMYGMVTLNGVYLYHYGTAIFLTCSMYAVAARYRATLDRSRRASESILIAHEDERKRLARDLHDGVVQSLLAIKLNLDMMRHSAERGGSIGQEHLTELASETKAAIDELRGVATDLRPALLESMGLADAMRWHADQVQSRTNLCIRVAVLEKADISARVRDHIYRIFQESLKNIVCHAHAQSVIVELHVVDRHVKLTIADDGKGIETSRNSLPEGGLGLKTIQERAELLGGSAEIRNRHPRGTWVSVTVPLEAG